MEKFTVLTAVAAPLLRVNIDTDVIIPSREMKRVGRTGLADGLFAHWRYSDAVNRIENPDFILNRAPYRQARILLAGANFGCGSSREHAVWALREWGVRAVLAPSFGAIFHGNCVRNGILPAALPDEAVASLARLVEADPETARLTVDLPAQRVTGPGGAVFAFEIAPTDKDMLLEGLDPIGVTLKKDSLIRAFEDKDRMRRPWAHLPSAR